MSTGESWNGIMHDVMEVLPIHNYYACIFDAEYIMELRTTDVLCRSPGIQRRSSLSSI